MKVGDEEMNRFWDLLNGLRLMGLSVERDEGGIDCEESVGSSESWSFRISMHQKTLGGFLMGMNQKTV
jgi:hypothetical protein